MTTPPSNPSIRQGRFQWMDDSAKKKYISLIKKRIADGYYFSEQVIAGIVEEIAPVINETVDRDSMFA